MNRKPIKNPNQKLSQQQPKAIQSFLQQTNQLIEKKSGGPRPGHLLFALDATASRQPTWNRACQLQTEMFQASANIGQLAIQLCYYRGFNEFTASPWLHSTEIVKSKMSRVKCLGGYTQIEKVLQHALTEHKQNRIKAVVFVGDAVEEDVDRLCHLAGQLGLYRLPLFAFLEGDDPFAARALKQMAQLSGGAFATFNAQSAQTLGELLNAVAVYATGGTQALLEFGQRQSSAVQSLTHQLLSDSDQ